MADAKISELSELGTVASNDELAIIDTDTSETKKVSAQDIADLTASPLTTKGDLHTYDTDDARLPIGSDNEFLIADSSETTGIKWAGQDDMSTATFYNSSDGTNDITSANPTISLDSTLENNDVSNYSLASNEITVSDAGFYQISYTITGKLGVGTRDGVITTLEVDTGSGYNVVGGSKSAFYGRITTETQGAGSKTITLDVSAGDKFRLKADSTGGDFSTQQNGTSLTFIKLSGVKGTKGDDGSAGADGDITWEGQWSAGEYTANQAVENNGTSYVATTTTSNEPPHADWDTLASKGDTGAAGNTPVIGTFVISSTGDQAITGVGFQPSMVKFEAQAGVQGTDVDTASGTGMPNNYAGGMTGYSDGANDQCIHSGGSGASINQCSWYSSSSYCIGVRYADANGANPQYTKASLKSFDADGFTVNVNTSAQNLLVMYTAWQ